WWPQRAASPARQARPLILTATVRPRNQVATMRQIIFDTETTGLDPAQGHRIIEIGCVEIINRTVTGNTLHLYLNPDRDSDPEALAVHGLTTEFLADKPRFAEVADQFLDFIRGAELIAHNASFDVKFFNAELASIGRGELAAHCGQ